MRRVYNTILSGGLIYIMNFLLLSQSLVPGLGDGGWRRLTVVIVVVLSVSFSSPSPDSLSCVFISSPSVAIFGGDCFLILGHILKGIYKDLGWVRGLTVVIVWVLSVSFSSPSPDSLSRVFISSPSAAILAKVFSFKLKYTSGFFYISSVTLRL